MVFYLLLALAAILGVIAITSFVLYVRARMNENEEKEKRFQSVHYISLALFVFLGVIIMIVLSNTVE